MTKIAISEPSTMLRIGLTEVISSLPGMNVVLSTDNIAALLSRLPALKPQIVILNPQLFEYHKRAVISSLYSELHQTKLIALVTSYEDNHVLRQFDGIIEINDDKQRIKSTINQVVSAIQNEKNDSDNAPLSEREKEVLVCLSKGLKNNEIAETLNISVHTVITHRKNIVRKTGIKSVAALTVYAILNNLIEQKDII